MGSSGGQTVNGQPSFIVPACIAEPSSQQGTWVPTTWTGEGSGYPLGGGGLSNSTNALGDFVEYPVVLEAGTYAMSVYIRQSSNVGQTSPSIDGSVLSVIEGYAVFPTYLKTHYTGLQLAAGTHLIRLTQSGKNASSNGYLGNYFGFGMVRTGP